MKNREQFEILVRQSRCGIKKCSWDKIYDSEEELINDLMKVNTDIKNIPSYKITMGYEYLSSFQKRINDGLRLTEKQMIQLKRLASSIAYNLYCL